jgi:cytochrome c peroxidase
MTISQDEIGDIDVAPPGTNGRFCMTCHPIGNAWVLTPGDVRFRIALQEEADGAALAANRSGDPVFRTNDGTVAPNANVATAADRARAYALLVSKGLIRVGLPLPAGADFTLTAVADPYGFASTAELSLFRRTLPMANLRFETTLMWDGREPSLASQAVHATLGHAQAQAPPSRDVVDRIVREESAVYFAQQTSSAAGELSIDGALGGPDRLATQSFTTGTSGEIHLFDAWASSPNAARASIARGQDLFAHRAFDLEGARATCTTCHDAPNVGTSSKGLFFDVGTSDGKTSDLPRYTLTSTITQEVRVVTDPGRALVTGRWSDIGRFKVPGLRGLAGRAPYFHDGSAASISDVVDHFDALFSMHLTDAERTDLVAFLAAL